MLNYLKRTIWKLLHGLQACESRILIKESLKAENEFPPVFIIGLPRSGSTIVYQLFTHFFDFAYLDNHTAHHWRVPLLADWIARKFLGKTVPHNTFQSTYGYGYSPFAPSEAGTIWARWFKKEQPYYVPAKMSQRDQLEFKGFIEKWSAIHQQSLLIKNLRFGQRIEVIREFFPNALFVLVDRSKQYNIQSVYLAPQKMLNDLELWCNGTSVDIPEAYVPRISFILKAIQDTFEKDLSAVEPDRILRITYENLCADPQDVLQRAHHFFAHHHVHLKIRELPSAKQIESGNKRRVDTVIWQEIERAVEYDW